MIKHPLHSILLYTGGVMIKGCHDQASSTQGGVMCHDQASSTQGVS